MCWSENTPLTSACAPVKDPLENGKVSDNMRVWAEPVSRNILIGVEFEKSLESDTKPSCVNGSNNSISESKEESTTSTLSFTELTVSVINSISES